MRKINNMMEIRESNNEEIITLQDLDLSEDYMVSRDLSDFNVCEFIEIQKSHKYAFSFLVVPCLYYTICFLSPVVSQT